MNFITRCPACGTMFKVVPDQLRISDGWVRCGQCAEVFEAPEHLQPDAVMAPPAAAPVLADDMGAGDTNVRSEPEPAPEISQEGPGDDPEYPEQAAQGADAQRPSATPDSPPEAGTLTQADAAQDEESRWIPLDTEESPPEMPADGAPPRFDAADPVQHEAASALHEADVDLPLDEPAPAPVSGFLTGPSAEPAPDAGPAHESPAPQVSFVQAARRKARWHGPRVRRLLAVACALLLVSLGLQVVLQQRDRIAALQPRSLGVLQALCVPLRCAVQPLRQIESIVIDSSSFRKVGDNLYQLNLGIKNGAAVALAMPSVELALTDTQDQAVLRRVLSPAELGAAAVLAAGADWSGSLPVGVADSSIAARIAGYRVLAFYP